MPGIGTLIASVVAASVPDPGVFKSERDFAAWLGLTPRQNSSGGKEKLGAITKQGNRYIRKMLVVGARSVLRVVGKRKGALADWINALRARKPGTASGRSTGQQAGQDSCLGDHDNRRKFPNRHVCKSMSSVPA